MQLYRLARSTFFSNDRCKENISSSLIKALGLRAVLFAFICIFVIPGVSYAQDTARVIEIHAKRFSFTPAEITLKQGETVKLVLISDDVTHGFFVPDLGIKEKLSKGHPVNITITPEKIGDFKGRCDHFCGSGHGSMTFVVHVKGS